LETTPAHGRQASSETPGLRMHRRDAFAFIACPPARALLDLGGARFSSQQCPTNSQARAASRRARERVCRNRCSQIARCSRRGSTLRDTELRDEDVRVPSRSRCLARSLPPSPIAYAPQPSGTRLEFPRTLPIEKIVEPSGASMAMPRPVDFDWPFPW